MSAEEFKNDFYKGVVWAAARIVELYDEPTIAAAVLRESGIPLDFPIDEADRPYVKKIFDEPWFYNQRKKPKK